MAQRLYIATIGGVRRLVRATHPANVRNHVARELIQVAVATPEGAFELAAQGVAIEETLDERNPLEGPAPHPSEFELKTYDQE